MTDTLPAPFTPADCDLEGFEFMPVDTRRVLKSATWGLATGDERAAAVALWFESWHQVPAGSLPTDERLLAKLADSPKWKRVREHALRGWVLCSDNRLYHPVVAEKALEAWVERLVAAISGAGGNAKRWGITVNTEADLQRLRDAVAMLTALSPRSKTLRKPGLLKLLVANSNASGGESGGDHPPESGGDPQNHRPPIARERERERESERDLSGIPPSQLSIDVVGGAAEIPPAPPSPPPRFTGINGPEIPTRAVVPLADTWQLPERWGEDAEALGFKPDEILREAEKFRQYFVAGKGAGTRRGIKGWRQSWSNWLAKAAETARRPQ